MSRFQRLARGGRRFFGSVMPAGLAGAFLFLTLCRAANPTADWLGALILASISGWLYGVGVLGLVRLFRVARWALPLAGLLAGPVPLALLFQGGKDSGDDRIGLCVLAALLGILIGLLEWAHLAYRDRTREREPAD